MIFTTLPKKSRFVISLSIVVFLFVLYLFSVPDVSSLKDKNPDKTSFMKFRENEWEKEGKKYKIQQKWVPISRISKNVVNAAIVAEDDKFWNHNGFDYEAIKTAMERNIKSKGFRWGGSTITQQLAKNLYLTPAKNIFRKIREAIITWKIEQNLSKNRIMEIYLNVVEWGDKGIFGIEAAARYYYDKSASELSSYEAANLIAVLPNPRRFNPINGSKYVTRRSNAIHRLMVRRGFVKILKAAIPKEEIPQVENNDKDSTAILIQK
ncbi:monofunctional biosynthetic peptidoglycan transglycosylase [Candidatus Poribacteria bacterium]|nr:monofunctional biosynthetic peptidoglycan transglycosylase [Candidatus Poribacteria bacterium]